MPISSQLARPEKSQGESGESTQKLANLEEWCGALLINTGNQYAISAKVEKEQGQQMITSFTGKPSKNGEEPIELIRLLTFEYLGELATRKDIELMEVGGNGNVPLLLAVIPNAKVENNKIVSIVPTAGKDKE